MDGCTQVEKIANLEVAVGRLSEDSIRAQEQRKQHYNMIDTLTKRIVEHSAKTDSMNETVVRTDQRTLVIERKLNNGINTVLLDHSSSLAVITAWVNEHGKNRRSPDGKMGIVDDAFNVVEKHPKVIGGIALFFLLIFGVISAETVQGWVLSLLGG